MCGRGPLNSTSYYADLGPYRAHGSLLWIISQRGPVTPRSSRRPQWYGGVWDLLTRHFMAFAVRVWGEKEEKSDTHNCCNPTWFNTQKRPMDTSSWVLTAGGHPHLQCSLRLLQHIENNCRTRICLELYLNGLPTALTRWTGCKYDNGHNFKSNCFDNKTVIRSCLLAHAHSSPCSGPLLAPLCWW